jgi:hypothetical protein
MIKLIKQREIAPYVWVHPDEDDSALKRRLRCRLLPIGALGEIRITLLTYSAISSF